MVFPPIWSSQLNDLLSMISHLISMISPQLQWSTHFITPWSLHYFKDLLTSSHHDLSITTMISLYFTIICPSLQWSLHPLCVPVLLLQNTGHSCAVSFLTSSYHHMGTHLEGFLHSETSFRFNTVSSNDIDFPCWFLQNSVEHLPTLALWIYCLNFI